ncbi:MAG: [Bacteroidales bacterium]|nr:[citrate (pro-3S)-lyase] ligase [Bacteroidales bacterium]
MFHSRRNREYWKACDKVQTEDNIVEIQRIPLSSPRFRRQVENFLTANGLRLEVVDDYFSVLDGDGSIVAGAGLAGDVIKCVAVVASARSRGLVAPLVSHIIAYASAKGIANLKVFTKPENEAIFTSLGFHIIAKAPLAILMENGHGLEDYLKSCSAAAKPGFDRPDSIGCPSTAGVIIMNANPFTLGHKYLVEKASGQVGKLFVIPVKEDVSLFPYEERLEMIRRGCEGLATVLEGSEYQISATTFPTYFLKDLTEAAETQMRLDLDLFARHIAPSLGVTVRFVGSEPSDPLTARYNELMKEILQAYGISVVELSRLSLDGNLAGYIQASDVRKALEHGSFRNAVVMTPQTTWPYLVAELVARSLRIELDTPVKPGLVDKDSNGAHSDMDYALMKGSIDVIRRSFIRHLHILGDLTGCQKAAGDSLREFGKAIEAEVLEYTRGVNTYRGAIFALGFAAIAALIIARDSQLNEYQDNRQIWLVNNDHALIANILTDSPLRFTVTELSERIAELSGLLAAGNDSHGAKAVKEHGVKGALQLAWEGYKPLFEDWLPFFHSAGAAGLRPYSAAAERGWTRPGPDGTAEIDKTAALQKTLLKIMSTLDDTCIIHRVGYQRAQEVKEEAKALLDNFSEGGLREMKKRYDAEGISPGGAADMLALTIFVDSLTN